ncbi:uncharacterized protein LOC126691525 [Quercus robur]|uniref:uncharacterized protein LOC126691525 n=1 Tax=Quercus robur TaxID=38942 RepID=UPI002163636B|nr:uncharacterized protein LOC126691525 [Quercus robur]
MEVQKHPSIEEASTFTIWSVNSWITPILSFLQDGRLPQDVEKARKVKKRAAKFMILNDTLYKRGFSMPYLKYVDEEEAKYILEEIHEGVYSDHASPRSLVEVEALSAITKVKIHSFVWKNIICRFGIPWMIISDNGQQFNN